MVLVLAVFLVMVVAAAVAAAVAVAVAVLLCCSVAVAVGAGVGVVVGVVVLLLLLLLLVVVVVVVVVVAVAVAVAVVVVVIAVQGCAAGQRRHPTSSSDLTSTNRTMWTSLISTASFPAMKTHIMNGRRPPLIGLGSTRCALKQGATGANLQGEVSCMDVRTADLHN